MTKEKFIERVIAGDESVLSEISRHRIYNIVRSGAFDTVKLSDKMDWAITMICEDAKGSYA